MAKGLFKIGDTWVNVHLVTKVEKWPAGNVSVYWAHGGEGGDGVAVYQYPNICETFSEEYLQQNGWIDTDAFITSIDEAIGTANG